MLLVGLCVSNNPTAHIHVVALLDIVCRKTTTVSTLSYMEYKSRSYLSWIDSRGMSRNVTWDPSKT